MSWTMALLVASSALQAVQQYSAAKASAKIGERQAAIQQQAYEDDAALAQIRGDQEEVARRKEFAYLSSENNNAVDYDPNESASWLALRDTNEETFATDLRNISLNTGGQVRKLQLSANSAAASGAAFRFQGKTAAVGLASGAAKSGLQAYLLS